ncbi:MAG: metallophosphoesterase family protein [Rhodothermales bacterium]|nr:metallophosphoesterase family protein [Rhodothermales bacterium]
MKLAVFSDVHSNLQALRAVLAEIDRRGADAVYCLGDLVGYGADPVPCVELVRRRCAAVVLGNHDLAVATGEGLRTLPRAARKAAEHNRQRLAEGQLAYLAGLPLVAEHDGCTFVHATPGDPETWQRLGSFLTALEQFEHFTTPVCFIGHSHVPAVMGNRLGLMRVQPGARFLINVGSVGQPRDGDPRACVGFFDTEAFTYELVRLPYEVEAAAARIVAAGLPKRLARRLERGL